MRASTSMLLNINTLVLALTGTLCTATLHGTSPLTDGVSTHEIVHRSSLDQSLGTSDKYKHNGFHLGSKREKNANYISSCGSSGVYLPLEDDRFDPGQMGYINATKAFCKLVSTTVDGRAFLIPPNSYIRSNMVYQNETAKSGSRIMLTSNIKGYIEFEINNKSDNQMRIDEEKCNEYLMKMAQTVDNDCYGSNNNDTRGGTWQQGTVQSGQSYHALLRKGDPK
ncbi:hypothetical protein B0J12DRAFT_705637 [Macrophomina phaseolina]|uniref:Uncharacterized protein n=1 Tax=Macrophomina phaseolina TaxID=35725 RepID=A0ABQ8FU97_9PEZI|nr:hypothetical protein B0J12DRAFT_705637 [Macrophomina phaseolina]